jgi:hypothetical protein
MKMPHLVTPHRLSVVLLLAVVGVCAPSARAALGGENGVVIPYAGKLELDGALVTGVVGFKFDVMSDGSTLTVCDSKTIPTVLVTNGEFSVSIGPVLESCVKGKDVHLNIAVRQNGSPTFVALGKQRVTPVLSAVTSGAGDFDVTGTLTATSMSAGTLTATATSAGSLTATSAIVTSLNNDAAANIAEFKAQNQTQGVGIGFNTVRATGSNANVDLTLSPKGTGKIVVSGPLQINGRQTITGASSSGVIIHQNLPDRASGTILAGTFVSRGGRHLILCSLTGFSPVAARTISVSIEDKQLDQPGGPVTPIHSMSIFANLANVHIAFPSAMFVTTLSPGNHVISVSILGSNMLVDFNDTLELTVIELP